jgi:hypothetical protein
VTAGAKILQICTAFTDDCGVYGNFVAAMRGMLGLVAGLKTAASGAERRATGPNHFRPAVGKTGIEAIE